MSDPIEAMRIHLRDIAGIPAAGVDAMVADPHARAFFATFAAAQLADNDAIDALGVGIARYRALNLPVTLVDGELSPPHLRARVQDLAAVLPDVRVVTLAGQGHVAHLEAPEALAQVIRTAAGQRPA
jgi:pimeloyl-ACP methyl ester carboxylesterase